MAYFPVMYCTGGLLLLTLEGMSCKKEAVHQAAEAPHIDAEGVGLAKDDLRRNTALGTYSPIECVSERSQLCSAAKIGDTG